MTYRPDPDFLRELGETSTNASNAWAGAENYLVQGLVHWIRQQVSDDQKVAVKSALVACRLVIDQYPTDGADAQAPKQYVDDMLAKIQRWVENPSNNNKEVVRSSLDTTRQLHAWQGHQDSKHFWILEAVDHASIAVWAGERSSYIVPLDFGLCAARSLACVLHALLLSGRNEADAVADVVGAISQASGKD